MTEERKKIIIKEIKYWKKNHLLPEHYCNFLLMLYSEGEGLEKETTKQSPRFLLLISALILGFSALGLTFIVIYFTSLSLQVQMLINILSFIFVGILAFYINKKDVVLFHIMISIGALIIFLVSTSAVMKLEENYLFLTVTIFINCFIWLSAGLYWKLSYLKWSGAIGLILAATYYFAH
ncbi:hypothetical protein [Alteribacillus bidgolensis]|uniref:DUF4401 domain-containing protein n=1 Tax=Alteribacillus bidgolensis TaxID=930129 RepID=A0A1G8P0S7_9BACI|nr:hypothetical protein [Alteribacillus bidgolensis]SDI86151.1 hypothetical protein SAMN05216352_11372 [Alteribacillus bidgolensis]